MLASGRSVRGRAIFTIICGILLMLVGVLAWIYTAWELSSQHITVAANDYGGLMSLFSGRAVNNPLAAIAQAQVINEHTIAATGGRTFAQIPAAEDAVRATAQTSAFLQSSLFTSVLAFALSLLVFGLGVLFVVIGSALAHLSSRFDGLGSALAGSNTGAGREGVVLDPGVSYTTTPVEPVYAQPQYVAQPQYAPQPGYAAPTAPAAPVQTAYAPPQYVAEPVQYAAEPTQYVGEPAQPQYVAESAQQYLPETVEYVAPTNYGEAPGTNYTPGR